MNRYLGIVLATIGVLLTAGGLRADDAALLPNAIQYFMDANGRPLANGKVYFYTPSTTTAKTTWTSASKATAQANPVQLGVSGRPTNPIYGDGSYRQIVKDSNNNTIWDFNTASTGSGGGSSPTATGDGDLVGTIKPWAGMTAPSQYAFTYGQAVSRTTYSALFTAITSAQSVFCTSGSPVLTGLSDTNSFWIGMTVEISCLAAGNSTVVSKTSSSVTLAANANVSTSVTATFFPWGRGDGSTTFNLPDFRGVVPVGNNIMGGVASSNLSSTYFGATSPNSAGALGGYQSTTLIAAYLPTHTHTSSSLSDPGHYHTEGDSVGALAGADISVIKATGTSTITGTSFSGMTISTNTGACPDCTQTPFNNIPPSRTTNFIIKITPDSNSATASGVTSLGGMTGDIACGTGLTCTGNTVSVTSSAAIAPTIYSPEQYGAVCDGVTDDGVALQAAATAASNAAIAGSVIFQVGQACATSTTVTLNAKDNIKVQFLSKGQINVIGSNANVRGLQILGGGTTGAATTITVSANYGTRDLTVASAAGLSIGDTILINVALGYAPQPTYARGMVNQIQNVVGNVLTLVQPLAWNVDATKTNSVQEITVSKNVEISGVKVDGSAYTGSGGIGFLYQYLSNSNIYNTFTTNFNQVNGSGSYGYALWASTVRDVLDTGSGDTASDSVQLWYVTNSRIENLRSYKSNGFGVGISYVSGNTISDLVSEYSVGRGVKLYGSCDNMIDRIRGDYAQGTLVGVAFTVGSCNNRVNHVQTLYNSNTGLWFNGLDNSNNTIHDVLSFGNGTYDIWIAATAPFTDNSNKITGIDARAINTLIDVGNTGDTLQYLPNANAGNFFRSDGAQTNTVSGVWAATNYVSNGTGNYASYNSVSVGNFGGTAAGAAYLGDNIYWDEAGATYRTNITNGAVGYALLRLGVGGLVQVATATGATVAGAAVVPAFISLVKQGDVFGAPAGSVSAAAIYFGGNVDTGFYSPSAGNLVSTMNGYAAQQFSDTQFIQSRLNAGPNITVFRDDSTPTNGDSVGAFVFRGHDSGLNSTIFGQITGTAVTVTDTLEEGSFALSVPIAGASTTVATFGVAGISTTLSVKGGAGFILTNRLSSSTAPVATTFCTTPSIPANNGTAAFTINVGTACATSVGTITMPTATTGWVCHFANVTAPASNTPSQTGGTTTTVTLTNYARTTGLAANWTDSNVIRAMCTAY